MTDRDRSQVAMAVGVGAAVAMAAVATRFLQSRQRVRTASCAAPAPASSAPASSAPRPTIVEIGVRPVQGATSRQGRAGSEWAVGVTQQRSARPSGSGDGVVLVTGAAGHLGANLVRRLLDDGRRVRAPTNSDHG